MRSSKRAKQCDILPGKQKFTLQGTNISHLKVAGKMIFLFHEGYVSLEEDMLVLKLLGSLYSVTCGCLVDGLQLV